MKRVNVRQRRPLLQYAQCIRRGYGEQVQVTFATPTTSVVHEYDTTSKALQCDNTDDDDDYVMMGIVRIFTGTLRMGDTVYVRGIDIDEECTCTVTGIYVLMGADVLSVCTAVCGAVVGVTGIQMKGQCAVLATQRAMPPFAPLRRYSVPIVRVSLESRRPNQMMRLRQALRRLVQADPCAQMEQMVSVTTVVLSVQQCTVGHG